MHKNFDLNHFNSISKRQILGCYNWVLNSGCTQYMTGDARMFNSINTNGNDGYDSITFGDNGKDKVKGLVRLQYPMT